MRKRLLEQQLGLVDQKHERAADILHRRHLSRLPPPVTPATPGINPLVEQGYRRKLAGMAVGTKLGQPSTFSANSKFAQIRKRNILRHAEVEMQRERNRRKDPGPPKLDVFAKRSVQQALFPTRYQRGELPCSIEHRGTSNGLTWLCPLKHLDYEYYLPMFVDGIRCTQEPYKFMARQGCHELIEAAQGFPERILPVVPAVIKPLRVALTTNDEDTVLAAIRVIKELALSNYGVGEALVPFYRQLLSVLNRFLDKRRNTGDAMDYGQNNGRDMFEAVSDVLEVLEKTGGPNAFASIKYMVPTYQSCCV